MKSLYRSYNSTVLGTFIIHMPSVSKSVQMAKRCLQSCELVGQKAELFEGFDGTNNQIITPEHLKNQSWVKWLKVTDHFQSVSEIACSLSHISLWVKCMEEDRPIVILEHDAIMVKSYTNHEVYNSISYLGGHEQLNQNSFSLTPIHSSINPNWHFMNRAHAYSIDPPSARKLFVNVLDRGIFESADVMIKCDDVTVVQTGFYAYDKDDGYSSQKTRKGINDHRSNV